MQKKTFEETLKGLHPWWKVAYEHGKLNDSWFVVKKHTEQHRMWQAYFDKLGWAPLRFVDIDQMTMPCEWPEWMPEIEQKKALPQRPRMPEDEWA